MDVKRRCGFLPATQRGDSRIVWGRAQTHVDECPKSFITGQSLSMLEEFFVSRALGIPPSVALPARTVDAFLVLREQVDREERNGTTD